MDKFLNILKALVQIIPLVKKLFPEQAKNLPESIEMSESVWDKQVKKLKK